jgi:hypothetical protein
MYDSVHLWLPRERLNYFDASTLTQRLTGLTEKYTVDTGATTITGKLENYVVTIKEEGIILTGSLCKLFFGNNFQTLNRKSTEQAIIKMSDLLSIRVKDATITRIDVAENLNMNYQPDIYYHSLGEMGRFKRQEQPNGIYYRQSKKVLSFYDKIREQKDKHGFIPDAINGNNILRYELRYISRLLEQFNRNIITASTLFQNDFYDDLLNRWQLHYDTIRKNRILNIDINFTKMKDLEKLLLLKGAEALGGEKVLMQMIEQAKQRGVFQYQMQVKRMKDRIKNVCRSPRFTHLSDEVIELDTKVKEAVNSHRLY